MTRYQCSQCGSTHSTDYYQEEDGSLLCKKCHTWGLVKNIFWIIFWIVITISFLVRYGEDFSGYVKERFFNIKEDRVLHVGGSEEKQVVAPAKPTTITNPPEEQPEIIAPEPRKDCLPEKPYYCNGECHSCPQSTTPMCTRNGIMKCTKKEEGRHTLETSGKEDEIELGKETITRFTWEYGGYEWYLEGTFYKGIYGLYKERSRKRDYDLFASDPYDDELIKSIADALTRLGKENGLGELEIAYSTVSFVQALPYTSDDVTTGFDEYPRFPYETLYDNGGDCEDTSILTAAILQELGYGVVLIELPGHMAVGVKCSSDVSGYYYMYGGQRYCYLETTGENWDVGSLPDEYQGKKARIIPIYKKPFLDIEFDAAYEYDNLDVYVDVDVTINNLGSEKARNTKMYIALQTEDISKVWDQIESEYLQIEPEESYEYTITNLHVPVGEDFRIYVRAYGDNIISDEVVSNWVRWE